MKPNFFIIGAPKCGTTAMSVYLRSHPNIFMSYPKEPHYFARDFYHHTATDSFQDYLSLFKKANPAIHKAIGEASVWYLFSKTAVKQIYQYNPDVQIVVMLRNPIDMFESLHAQALYNRYEDQTDPEAAWDIQKIRADGHMIPKTCPEPKVLQYKAVVSLGQQMRKLYTHFPSEQVLPIIFDDFKKDPGVEYNRVLAFLGVEKPHPQAFAPVNERKKYRSEWLGDLIENPPHWLRLMARKSRQHFNISWGYLADLIRKINSEKIETQLLSVRFQKKLIAELTGDINILSNLLDRDLSCWLQISKDS